MRLLPFAVLATLLILAAPARAAGPKVGITDDRILLGGGQPALDAVNEWEDLGIEQVRIMALWNRIAPPAPGGEYDWLALDQAVNLVVAHHIKPILTITGPGPLWVSRR